MAAVHRSQRRPDQAPLRESPEARARKSRGACQQQEAARRQRELKRKRAALEQQISGLRAEHEASAEELRQIDEQVGTQTRLLTTERTELGRLRHADVSLATRNGRAKRKLKKSRP